MDVCRAMVSAGNALLRRSEANALSLGYLTAEEARVALEKEQTGR
jgi:hypothetical protein